MSSINCLVTLQSIVNFLSTFLLQHVYQFWNQNKAEILHNIQVLCNVLSKPGQAIEQKTNTKLTNKPYFNEHQRHWKLTLLLLLGKTVSREVDIESDEQRTLLVVVFVVRHTLVLFTYPRSWPRDLFSDDMHLHNANMSETQSSVL